MKDFRFSRILLALLLAIPLALTGCGDDGDDGAPGTQGEQGDPGDPGTQGEKGDPGADGGSVEIADLHGQGYLLSTGDFADAGKFFANVEITSATAAEDGTATVNFTVKDQSGAPVTGVTGVDFAIAKLVPASGGESFNKWVPYIYRSQTVSDSAEGDWPNPDGTAADQGYRESDGAFEEDPDVPGSYTYVFATDLSNVVTPVAGTPISYERNLTHRIAVQMGGHSGPTGEDWLDFVPDGSPVTETRNIIETASCQGCHGEFQFQGHGGDRLNVEGCVTCHNPSTTDPHGGQTVDMKVMIHKIHAGGELASIHNAVEDSLTADTVWELSDAERENFYAIWGYRNNKHTWWKVEFPAVIANCTKCHQGTGEDVDNWMDKPSRAACGACHDDVDFAVGTNHGGGSQPNDNNCSGCHPKDGPGWGFSVAGAHDWTSDDNTIRTSGSGLSGSLIDWRNIPEFDIDLTVSAPPNGTHFEAGESPVVSIVINENGTPIDHTSVVEDTDGDEGCPDPDACPVRDGDFDRVYLLVHGPRAERNPVLTMAARAAIVGATGPFDLSGATKIALQVDNGQDLLSSTGGGSITRGNISVELDPVAAFAVPAAATAGEVVDWLNGDAAFAARAIAYLDEATGGAAIRSRNLGKFFAVQLEAGDVNTAVFGGDTDIHVPGGFYPRNNLIQFTDPADNDPKATWNVASIEYELDPVDDLKPGTYIASVEIGDAGRINGDNYKTPSVAKTAFQVGTPDEELAPAGNCGTCHQGPQGTGFILDYPRHYKIFDNTAIDQCGACHDYQSQRATADANSSDGWAGARPIAKRVHAVHYGSRLDYPLLTVNYSRGDPVAGRNWDITFPRDILECETCHTDDSSSGSWKTEPARIPCSGCHDSDEATAHMKLMTYDPTPDSPWNGDEEESCKLCHG